MIVTPDFVFINNPRTGSTFARKALKLAYAMSDDVSGSASLAVELILPALRGRGRAGRDHHATYAQIPPASRSLPVVSTVRNPFTHLVSIFELGLWRGTAEAEDPDDGSRTRTLETFLRAQEAAARQRWPSPTPADGFGPQSLHFLQMFAADPSGAFRDLHRGAPPADMSHHVADVRFLRQETLRQDLCDLLRPFRDPIQLRAVSTLRPSHVTVRSRDWKRVALDPSTAAHIRRRESFLFDVLASRGIAYSLDNADFSQAWAAPPGAP